VKLQFFIRAAICFNGKDGSNFADLCDFDAKIARLRCENTEKFCNFSVWKTQIDRVLTGMQQFHLKNTVKIHS